MFSFVRNINPGFPATCQRRDLLAEFVDNFLIVACSELQISWLIEKVVVGVAVSARCHAALTQPPTVCGLSRRQIENILMPPIKESFPSPTRFMNISNQRICSTRRSSRRIMRSQRSAPDKQITITKPRIK